jgi:hypothetical protein
MNHKNCDTTVNARYENALHTGAFIAIFSCELMLSLEIFFFSHPASATDYAIPRIFLCGSNLVIGTFIILAIKHRVMRNLAIVTTVLSVACGISVLLQV